MKIKLYPKTFNDAKWQTNENFCASWCLFFISITILNPQLSMVDIYKLFSLKQEKIRYLLFFKFLFWYCNSEDYKNIARDSDYYNIIATNLKNYENKLLMPVKKNINKKKKYYCKKFIIHNDQYSEYGLSIVANIYEHQKNLTSLIFTECSIGSGLITSLNCLKNLKKLTFISCELFNGSIKELYIPKSVVKISILNSKFDPMIILNNLPKTIEYICTNVNYENLLVIINKHQNTIFHLLSFNIKLSDTIKNKLNKLKNKNIIYNKPKYFYKPIGELSNNCLKCTGNDNVNFNNEIEEMKCIKCSKDLINENSKIK
jgi:hypothetical protein